MKLQTRPSEEPEINLTSLIDVVLLLLVFFMVSTSFVKEAELKVELPEATIDPVPLAAPQLEITVNAEGEYFVNRQPLIGSTAEVLSRAIEKVAGAKRDLPLTIKADARSSHQSVVTVMDTAGKMGFSDISIITVKSTDGSGQ